MSRERLHRLEMDKLSEERPPQVVLKEFTLRELSQRICIRQAVKSIPPNLRPGLSYLVFTRLWLNAFPKSDFAKNFDAVSVIFPGTMGPNEVLYLRKIDEIYTDTEIACLNIVMAHQRMAIYKISDSWERDTAYELR